MEKNLDEKINKRFSVRHSKKGICAEVYGEYNKAGDFKAWVIPKTEEQKELIKSILKKSFMFAALNKQDM